MRDRVRGILPLVLSILLGTSTSVVFAGFVEMDDVDKPTGTPTTYNTWGDFTNINADWNQTCWQAVSAGMLNSVGFGNSQDIYNWFHDPCHYGNNGVDDAVDWSGALNDFIMNSGFTTEHTYLALSKDQPKDDWAQAMIASSPIGLAGECGGDYSGRHTLGYGGFHDVNDYSWIANPDGDLRLKDLPEPPDYKDWVLFRDEDDPVYVTYKWQLQYLWKDGHEYTFDVEGAVYFEVVPVPEPATIALLGFGMLMLKRRR